MSRRSLTIIASLFVSLFLVGFATGISQSNSDEAINYLVAANTNIIRSDNGYMLTFACEPENVLYTFDVETNTLIPNTLALAAMKFNPPIRFFNTFPNDTAIALAGGASGGLTVNGLIKGIFSARKLSFAEKALAALAIVSGPGLGMLAADLMAPNCYSGSLRRMLDEEKNWQQIEAGMLGIGYRGFGRCLGEAKTYYLENRNVRDIKIRDKIIKLHKVATELRSGRKSTPAINL